MKPARAPSKKPVLPKPGQVVHVRQRQHLVEEVHKAERAGDATLIRLSCLDDDAQGVETEVLWENEIDAEIVEGEAWDKIAAKGFDPPKTFGAYINTLRWNCVTASDPRLFQSPFRAGIKIEAFQLEPLRKALLLPRVNLFIADDVGLGKTIEAGLILRELLLRKKVREVVVACPPSMLLQWQDELETRFGLTFEIFDRDYVARVRQERGYGVNPWTTHSRFLISHRLLVDEAYVAPLRDWLGEFRAGTVLILDEAHHAAPASGAKYAIDSKITRAVRDLAHRFEHRLFLSATPHNGHSNSFSALLEIMDPQRFCRGVPVRDKKTRGDVLVRRLKEDLRLVAGGFPKRAVVQEDIKGLPADAPELRLSALLDEYRRLLEERTKDETKRKQSTAKLLISGLQQRLLSSVEAFARTLKVHRRTMERYWSAKPPTDEKAGGEAESLDLLRDGVGADDDRASLSEEALGQEEETQFEAATREVAGGASRGGRAGRSEKADGFEKERGLLDEMTTIAEAARGEPDARVCRLVDWIRKNMCPGLPPLGKEPDAARPPKWNETRVILFTEYDDTKRYLFQQLSAALAGTDRADERIMIYHGPTPVPKREEIKRAFNEDPKKHPVRILIATDAAREGLNLQSHCQHLFHFDVPWNPARMEQRNGRIDRKLQPKPEVFCHYFVYVQRPEDRILKKLVEKSKTIKEELGSLAQVVEGRLADLMRHGITRDDIERLEREIDGANPEGEAKEAVAEELEEARERQEALLEQIATLRKGLDHSRKWVGLEEDQFRAAISAALALMKAPPLERMKGEAVAEGEPDRWVFPALDQRHGADATWTSTLDTLRERRKDEQKFWEWRREAKVRPVVFEDPGRIDEGVVHLHLEHRVVQRLLARFRTQGFVRHDLSRACLAQSSDSIPRVALLGRLCLFGPGGSRLHEELVSVSAEWVEPAKRKDSLKTYKRDAHQRTHELLFETLARPGKAVGEVVQKRLLASVEGDVGALLGPLEEVGEEKRAAAEEALRERGRREAKEMKEILESQRKRVVAEMERRNKMQQEFDFWPDEAKKQVEAERRAQERRLPAIDRELKTEPARIEKAYEVQTSRVEPVGIVYLWPATG